MDHQADEGKSGMKRRSPRVARTRNLNTETESEHMGKIRSALRRLSKFWKPALKALEAVKRPYTGTNKRIKHEYLCAGCGKWFQRKLVHINHITPCGTLKTYEDVPSFLERLFREDDKEYNILCKEDCHKKETKEQLK